MKTIRQTLIRTLLVSALAASASPAFAFNEEANYNACILRSLSNTWNRNVVEILRGSCDRLYRQWSMLSPSDKAFNECLLQNLPGVQSSAAIGPVMSACRRQSADSMHFD
ncbi:VF_A0006 family four-cysteine protein [Burkholderia gladioli]|uniref:VF_A0006 family four-cysteine protein n=1 Tax=Burkholderia gladioli TaxID=28095 RepID=UPI0003A7A787|nr:VF_A0006 family four-cysteine protein [Burkholderia gladioli]NHH84424.1 hypothetical protein [Burkholderia gladioli]CAG9234594.1 conserved exported hypothetical protein [Burkholderia gladioli]